MPSALLLAACAVGHASPAGQMQPESPAPPQPYLQPPPFVRIEPARPEKERLRPIVPDNHELCARDIRAGALPCMPLPPTESRACVEACVDDYEEAHIVRLPLIQNVSSTPPAPASPPQSALKPSDPFAVALGDCMRRVREGAHEPVCHFLRPLDAMGFGQKHCDAKCAALTAEDRANGAGGGP
jgi:hypothetical protein